MRKLSTLTLASAAVVAIACGKSKSPTSTAMSADLKRDLQLASATQNIQISPDEITPSSQPAVAMKPKKAPQGPKVIRTEHPTLKASPAPVEQAEVKQDIPQVQVMASVPAPSESPAPDSPPLARPSPLPSPEPSAGRAGHGGGEGTSAGSGVGAVLGGIFGAVIRGGMIGDDDHCDPRGGRRGNTGTDIYYPQAGRVIPGGMGGMRGPMRGRP